MSTANIIVKGICITIFILVLYTVKPRFMFKNNGQPREWGVGLDSNGYKKTLLDIHSGIIVFSILCIKYYK
jgi:hypothetical protein